MLLRKLAVPLLTLCLATPVFAADPAPLPAQMKGSRTNPMNGRSGVVEVELIAMETPTVAKVKSVFYDGCTRSGESTAEFKDDAWTFVIPSIRCNDVQVTVRPVAGKNRLEGEFRTGAASGTIYFEW